MRMLDAEMFLIAQINESVITSPAIGMNDAFKVYTATYDALEGGSGAIRNDFRIDIILAFEQTKNNVFSACSTTSDSSDPASDEVAFINFDFPFDGRLRLAITGNSFPESSHYRLMVFRLTPDNFAICEAVKSTEKSFTSCRIFASEILERYAYLFFIVMTGWITFLAHLS